MKSGNLHFLEPSGPLQACNGTEGRRPDGYALLSYSGSNLGRDTGYIDSALRVLTV